jgi:HEAT repeat protein
MDSSAQALIALKRAVEERDADALWTVVPAVEGNLDAVPLLAELLLAEWHECHEDVVFTLGLIGDPRAVDPISEAVLIPFESLVKWDNLHEFQRKCAYALARIGTVESRAALEALVQHQNTHIREYAKEGLQNWPMPYQGNEYA